MISVGVNAPGTLIFPYRLVVATISGSNVGETTNCAPAWIASFAVAASSTVPTPTTHLSPNWSARYSMPAIAFGVDIVTSIPGTPPASSAWAMSGSTSLDGARMTAITPASAICWKYCSLVLGMEKNLADVEGQRQPAGRAVGPVTSGSKNP